MKRNRIFVVCKPKQFGVMEGTNKKTKRIPYGMMNFEAVRTDNCYYVDKTMYIPAIEEADRFFFFIRPRRFGKSLTISMLQHYYDINSKDKFDSLFGNLYIGKHPTEDRNSYLIISLNFSGLAADLGNYRSALDEHCNTEFCFFCDRYKELLPGGTLEELKAKPDACSQLNYLCKVCKEAGQKIYLFIDEYDHFTNDILSSDEYLSRYMDETHGEGYLRTFFNKIKDGTSTSIARCFITGVSPVTLDDLTSGFNIGSNYSIEPQFNEFMGFMEEEVRAMLTYYSQHKHFNHTVDELIELMRPWYDNYCFAARKLGKVTVYNSDMVLYFVKNYITEGEIPQEMLDTNIRVDYSKLRMLVRKDREFANNASVIQTLVSQGFVSGVLKRSFPASDLIKPDNFISLLYYFGMVTVNGTYRDRHKFIIPNQVIREQIFGYLLEMYERMGLSFDGDRKFDLEYDLAYSNAWRPYFDYIAERVGLFASQRDKSEAYVHGFVNCMTSFNPYYRPISELDTQAGYADIFLLPRRERYPEMQHSYVIELKYAKMDDSESEIRQKYEKAKEQVERYASTEVVQSNTHGTTLHKLVVLYQGTIMRYCEELDTLI